MKHNFGLVSRSYPDGSSDDHKGTQWSRFTAHLSRLNAEAASGVGYKLMFLARHGQGYHNVAEARYGRKAWDCYYSLLPGDGKLVWADAHLTPLGVKQANTLSDYWRSMLREETVPAPGLWVSSPLTRALRTAEITWRPLAIARLLGGTEVGEDGNDLKIHVLENLRECVGIHTCDQRSTRSKIAEIFPSPIFEIEGSMTQDDELWRPDLRESDSAMTVRLRSLLDQVLGMPLAVDVQVLSLTAHGGAIMAILRAIGHRDFGVAVGGCVPVLVRVERLDGKRPAEEIEPWLPKEDCGDVHEPIDQVAN